MAAADGHVAKCLYDDGARLKARRTAFLTERGDCTLDDSMFGRRFDIMSPTAVRFWGPET